MGKPRTVSRGIRYPEEWDTWLKRAAKKANAKSVNTYIAQIIGEKYEGRHAK